MKTLLLIAILASSATAQPKTEFIPFIGGGVGAGGSEKVISFGVEAGYLFEMKDTAKTAFSVYSLEIGMMRFGNAPKPEENSIPHNDYTVREFSDGDMYANIVFGQRLADNIGMGLIWGFMLRNKVELKQSNASGWFYKHDESSIWQAIYGVDLRYFLGRVNHLTVGYVTKRGIKLGYSFAY